MTNKVQRTFNAWVHLTADEQLELNEEILKFRNSLTSKQLELRTLSESVIQKMQTGPLGGTCPYCGR
jgi:hypothetical protein